MAIEYRTGDLFSVTDSNAVLTHACNAQGAWGSGVARGFQDRFPEAFKRYAAKCAAVRGIERGTRSLVGTSYIDRSEVGPSVGVLFTSDDYGPRVDGVASIVAATRLAFQVLIANSRPSDVIHMPRINSGLFRVEWARTEAVLEEVILDAYTQFEDKVRVVVWTP